MSTFSITDYNVQFDGHACKMGGIGGVATLPQYRRKGGIRGCFNKALPDMYATGYDFSYLYPFSTAYYRKFGYENCVQKYHATVLLGLLNPPEVEGVFRMAEAADPMTEAIQTVDRAWEQHFNMMVQHEYGDYDWTKEVDPAVKQVFTYVYFSGEGQPKAYTTFQKVDQPDGRNLVCRRFVFTDKEGYLGLMHLFKSLSSDHMFVKFDIPAVPAMRYLMPEWSLGAAQWSVQPAGMVRVVHVKHVLEKARYIGSGHFVLEIQDKQIPENNRRFAVDFENGRAASVSETEMDPDAIMAVSTFSALISGVCDFETALAWMSGLEIRNSNPSLAVAFYPKPLMIADYF